MRKISWHIAVNIALALAVVALSTVTLFPPPAYADPDPGWLTGWGKRVKLTIDQNDIGAALSDFPILLYISDSSGRNSDNISFVFDELTADANRKKIAVTTDNGETECYVEIEKWDDANEQAWLWIKVPSIASDADTDLYLYYDSTHAANDYVGDTNDAVAENAWDAGFEAVYHMSDGVDNEHIYDSTSHDNDGTKKGAGEPAVTTSGKIGDAQDFAGDNDYIDISSVEDDIDTAKGTITGWVSASTWADNTYHFVVDFRVDGSNNIELYHTTGNRFQLKYKGGGAEKSIDYDSSGWGTEWHFFAITWDVAGDEVKCYIDDALIDTFTSVSELSGVFDGEGSIGSQSNATNFWEDFIDEIRISAIAREPEWIKASYETQRDHLLDWGSEETLPVTITITAPTGGTDLLLAPETNNQSLITSAGSVTSNVNFDITAKDSMNGKDAGDAGHLTEWTGAAWNNGSKLNNAVKVNTTHSAKVGAGLPHALTADDFTIISNASSGTDVDLEITVKQDTDAGDVALTEAGHWYKIVITFTASEHT